MSDTIFELSKFISKRESYNLNLWKDDTLSMEIFNLIHTGEITSEQDFSNYYFKNNQKTTSFKKFIKRYENRLIHGVFLINTDKEEMSVLLKNYSKCIKFFLAAELIRWRANYPLSLHYYEKSLKISIKFGFSTYVMLASQELMQLYSAFKNELKNYNRVQRLYSKYFILNNQENKIKTYHYQARIHWVIEKDLNKTRKFTSSIRNEITEYIKTSSTYFIQLQGNLLLIFDSFVHDRYQEAIDRSNKIIKILTDKFKTKNALKYFYRSKGQCYLAMRDFKNAEENFLLALDQFNKEESTYSYILNDLFNIHSYAKNYTKLYELTYEAFSLKALKKSPQFEQEWKIKEAYVQFLNELGLVDAKKNKKIEKSNFKLNKFLNEVPIYNSDKAGINVSILIIQLLWLLKNNDHNAVIDRLETMRQYTYRYLKNDETFRYNCFVKMLLQIPRANFHPFLTSKYTENLLKKLKSKQTKLYEHTIEVEIIPFEDLWEITLDMLEKNLNKTKT